jgi:hypothetical protein
LDHYIHPLWNHGGHSGFASIDFESDWVGFNKVMLFKKSFEAKHYGEREYYGKKKTKKQKKKKNKEINCLDGWPAKMTTNLEAILVFISGRIQI